MNRLNPADIYLLKINNRNTKRRCEICSKLTIKTTETRCSSVSIFSFEHVYAGWEGRKNKIGINDIK